MSNNKWILRYGVHRGTYMSRDMGPQKNTQRKRKLLQHIKNTPRFIRQ
jgi:hypothetical protein